MRRTWTVPADDQDYIDRSAAFLQEAVHFFGGVYSVIAHREQAGDEEFEPVAVTFRYESFAPAQRRPVEVEEHADTVDLEPEPAEVG